MELGEADIALPSIAALPPLLTLSRRAACACCHSRRIALFGALLFLLPAAGALQMAGGSLMPPQVAVGCLFLLTVLALLPIRKIR